MTKYKEIQVSCIKITALERNTKLIKYLGFISCTDKLPRRPLEICVELLRIHVVNVKLRPYTVGAGHQETVVRSTPRPL